MTSIFISFIAGLLSTLSPCVFPLLPIVVGSSLQKHKFGPIAMAMGLVVSFTSLGLFLSTIGFSIGISTSNVRLFSGILLVLSGFFIVNVKAQELLIKMTAPLSSKAQKQADYRTGKSGLWGQFILGLLLGAIWSPCVGPTLGAAFALASQGEQLSYSTLLMFVFSIGTTLPLLLISYVSKTMFSRNTKKTAQFLGRSKLILGWILIVTGALTVFGIDKLIEVGLLTVLPDSFLDFLTQF